MKLSDFRSRKHVRPKDGFRKVNDKKWFRALKLRGFQLPVAYCLSLSRTPKFLAALRSRSLSCSFRFCTKT